MAGEKVGESADDKKSRDALLSELFKTTEATKALRPFMLIDVLDKSRKQTGEQSK